MAEAPRLAALVDRARRGDGAALQELLVAHLPAVEAYVRLRAGAALLARESVSDLVQSFCLQALRALDDFEFRGEAEFRQWLFKNALHKVVNKARHHRAAKRAAAAEVAAGRCAESESGDAALSRCYANLCTPSRRLEGKEALAAFERAFAELGDDYQEAIALHRLAGMPYEEIARVMDRSVGAVRNLVYRGLARLATALDD